ncbi:MAG: DUF445 family protein [Treponema sp.]|nr:DUF445 family protein [Treponema sp.]
MTFKLAWLLPPIAGAIIGYATNVVAIKMLFRPLKEYRVFGIRVPFTPGILPKERSKLADSIGRMVETELLTPEILRKRLTSPDVTEGLRKALSGYTEKILTMPAAQWLPGISGYIVSGAKAVYPYASGAVINFLRRDEIRETIEAQLRQIITKAILELNIFQRLLITAGQYDKTINEKIPDIVNDLVLQLDNLLKSEEGEGKIIGVVENQINKIPEDRPDFCLRQILAPLGSWVGPDPKEKLDLFLAEKILNTAIEQIDSLLTTIDIKSMVAERINSLDMLRVEKLILDVLAGQLWWIDIFGGILGFLIGIFQTFLSIFL